MSRFGFWWSEVLRRRVLRVAAWYLAGAWGLAQVADLLFDAFDLSGYTRFVIGALVAGLPVALVLAWIFDITPRGIVRTLSLEGGSATEERQAPGPAPENSVAVLPFTNLSPDPGDEYFSDGLAEEIRNQLARVPELRVAARTSSFAFKGRHEDARTIGRRLNVATLLEGGVRRHEDRVRIDVQLVGAADGYQVWIYALPGAGLGDIGQTSQPLGALVDQVRAQTGAARVDLIGHSQGGLVARYYVKNLGGSAKVDRVISLGAPHYGTYAANIATFFGFGSCLGITACEQMSIGSSFLASLNAGPDVISPVRYTNIYTAYDELVRPVGNATLRDGATNVKVQDQCWLRVVGHLGLILDGTVYDGVRDALRNESVRMNCFAL